ncbi:hypothetical protein [Nocardioides sp. SYSU D00065]|uniref:hypothetical protein n=1 Tax=Nocardioides sp. SYSU D00065 TaxID=2817378 RepID=UPI001B31BAE6|nr:hypothetical protein [Nocardioides sp. SYSU D00065]
MGDEQQGQATGLVTGDAAAAGLAQRVEELERELLRARQAALVSRDHVVGIEAEIGRQNADILRLTADLRRVSARAARLASVKKAQQKRIVELRSRLETVRKRNAALTSRVQDLETARPSLARRVARRLRGRAR